MQQRLERGPAMPTQSLAKRQRLAAYLRDSEQAFMTIPVWPEDRLSGTQADESGADRGKDGYTSFGDVGVLRIDELVAMFLAARRVRELDHAVHRDNVRGNSLGLVDGGASQFFQPQLADLGKAAGGAGGQIRQDIGFAVDHMDGWPAGRFGLGHGYSFPEKRQGAPLLAVRHIALVEPRARGRMRRNPGLDAREKLSPVMAEPEMMTQHLHGAMMSPLRAQVKPAQCFGWKMPNGRLALRAAQRNRGSSC